MKETSYKNVHRQITNLISLIELCLPFTEEISNTKNRLKFLPDKLEYLKAQAEYLDRKFYTVNADSISHSDRVRETRGHNLWEIEDTELELDFLVTSLEDTLIYLEHLKEQIDNLIVLKERVEALQEERLVGITPERIYKLIEKQQLEDSLDLNDKSSEERNYFKKIWHKIADYKYSKKIAKSTAIAAGIIFCFSVGSYSSMKERIDGNALQVEKTEQSRETLKDI